jgi:hypothetical protein
MMRPGAASPAWRAWRRHAPLTVVLATLPLMLLAALAVYVLWQRQQDELRIQHRATARAIAAAVERELAGTVRQLEYMATSPLLDAPKLDAFRNDAERALATSKHWSNLVVFDAGAQQVLNTRNPVPETRSTAGQDHVRAVLLEGRPLVSDVFVGPSSGKPVAAVTVPVMREGRARAALSVALDLPTLDALLQSSAGESAVVAAIWDRHHHFITRSIAPEKHRGQQPVPSLVQASRAAPEGWRRLKTL